MNLPWSSITIRQPEKVYASSEYNDQSVHTDDENFKLAKRISIFEARVTASFNAALSGKKSELKTKKRGG